MPKLETVKISHGDGFKVVNTVDFDPDTMTKYEEKPNAAAPSEEKPKRRRGRSKKAE